MQNQRCHTRAVAPLLNDAARVEIVGIVQSDSTVQQPVSQNRHTVEERRNRGHVRGGSRFDRRTGPEGVGGDGKPGGRLRSDEHDVVADRERRILAVPQPSYLCRGQIHQGRLVGNLRNRRPAENLAVGGVNGLFETRGGSAAPLGILVAPALDLEPYGIRSLFEFTGEPGNRAVGTRSGGPHARNRRRRPNRSNQGAKPVSGGSPP